MTNVPIGAATAAAREKFYVYRPMLDLIGKSEGTDKGRGYNETLGYGMMLDGRVTKGKGPTVDLVSMTREQVDKLQSRMLKDPDNRRLRSSAVGRFQEIRTTRRAIDEDLGRTGKELFDAAGQDEDACYLLGQRGIDKWLAGRLSLDTLIRNLAQEWASIPKPDGKGHYAGQNAGVSVSQVKAALAEVAKRHAEGQPRIEVKVPVPVDQPVVPEKIDNEVKKKTNLWGWLTTIFGSGGVGLAGLLGADWQTILAIGGLSLGGLVVVILLRRQIIAAVQDIRGAVEG
jgi:muramidase (phage lysozyme)